MLVLQSWYPPRTAQGMQHSVSYESSWPCLPSSPPWYAYAAASSLQGSGQFLRQLRNLLPDQDPFPFLPLLQAHQFVSQIERRQDRDAGRIGRIHVLGHLAHLAVHEIGQTLKVPAVVAAAHAVHRAKDLYFRAASGHGFHVRGPPAKPSNKYRDASGLAEAGLYHSFVTPQVRAKRVVSRIAGLPLPPFLPLGEGQIQRAAAWDCGPSPKG